LRLNPPITAPLPKTLPRFFLFFLKRHRWRISLLFITILGWPINEMVIPLVLNRVVTILGNGALSKPEILDALEAPALFFIGMLLINEMLLRSNDWLVTRTIPRFRSDITGAMFDYTSQHSHRYFADTFSGSIGNRVNKLAWSMASILFDFMHNFVPVTASFLIAIILMWFINPLFSLIIAVWFVVQMGCFWLLMRRCHRLSEHHSEAISALNGAVVDVFNNAVTMRLFAREAAERHTVDTYIEQDQTRARALLHYLFKAKAIFGAISVTMLLGWWGLTISFWYHDRMSLGDVAQLLMQQWQLTGLTWYMGMQLMRVYEEVGICNESLSVIREAHEVVDAEAAAALVVTRGAIVLENVSFQYQPQRDVFTNLSVTLNAGEKVGLVGLSGSGKTTFVNLLLRLYDVQTGRILIDGQDISRVTQESLRRQIAMIPQDPALFHRSLLDNIRYGRLEATDAEVIKAAQSAHADEFITALKDGYHTVAGERGIKLSGGQRQRIAIARALLKNAPILILDEATSALDSLTERAIQNGLGAEMQGKTAIVIAHRLATLAAMDRILVFDGGRIVEDGTQAALLARNGHFAKLWQMQQHGFLPE